MLAMVSATPHLVGAVAVCSGHPRRPEEISALANGGGGGGGVDRRRDDGGGADAGGGGAAAGGGAADPPVKQMGTVLCFGSVFIRAMREALAKSSPRSSTTTTGCSRAKERR